jgi:hypothetical protein
MCWRWIRILADNCSCLSYIIFVATRIARNTLEEIFGFARHIIIYNKMILAFKGNRGPWFEKLGCATL